jgi:ubiquitin-protein ligase
MDLLSEPFDNIIIYPNSNTEVCLSILTQIPALHPEYKPGVNLKDIFGAMNKASSEGPNKKKYYRFVSQIYFESRKAIEYRMQKLEEKSKK